MQSVYFTHNNRNYQIREHNGEITIFYGLVTISNRPELLQAAQRKLAIVRSNNVIDLINVKAIRKGCIHAKSY